jgi:cytoskeletal protein RodZ
MSTKTITWTIIVVLVILGIWWYMSMGQQPSAVPYNQTQPTATNSQTNNTTTTSTTNGSPLTTSSADNSDVALNQDLVSINTQMSGLTIDTASADSGLSNPNQ